MDLSEHRRGGIGLCQPCLVGEQYLVVEDKFMEVVHARWPKEIVQGIAGVALAGLLGAIRAHGSTFQTLLGRR